MIKHKGTRWFKCDFHLHTNASLCFEDINYSHSAFIDKVVSSKLDCIAITDHNTGKNIDEIKVLAAVMNVVVFPGVEITCSDAKIHLLVLFNTTATTATIEDYLIRLGLTRDKFGQADAHIHKTVKDIIEETTKYGGLVIPAHIDEYSGLSNIAQEAKKDVFSLNSLTSVQIVHEPLCQDDLTINGNLPLLEYFKQYYNTGIDEGTIKQWNSCAGFIKSIAKLTFSDNPCDEFSPKHGLWGIGRRYSWIKMDEIPTLESLRQALVLPSLRIKNFFESPQHPYAFPQMWLKKLSVINTIITKKGVPLSFEFSPQMTTIIGGRGSGKSSVLRLIRGALGIIADVEKLPTIIADITSFYKSTDNHGEGIFTPESIIELEIYKNNILYKLNLTNIASFGNQQLKAQRFNNESKAFENIDADGLSSLFPFEIFDQKQIYEIAKFPNALRTRIDNAIPLISIFRNIQLDKIAELLSKAELIRTAKATISQKSNLRAQLDDINAQIKNYNDSGISELIKDRQSFLVERTALDQVYNDLSNKLPSFSILISEMVMPSLGINKDSSKHFEELISLVSNIETDIKRTKTDLEITKATYETLIAKYKTDISKTDWAIAYKANNDLIQTTKTGLEQKGVTSINDFEVLFQQKEVKTKELSDLESVEQSIITNEKENVKLYQEIISLASEITNLRIDFLNGLLQNQNVQIRIKPFRDKSSYEKCFREIIQRDSGFSNSISNLITKCYSGKLPDNLLKINADLDQLRAGKDITEYDGHFKNLIAGLGDVQFDRLKLIVPEDEIFAEFKQPDSEQWKSITNASAGQKTSSILSFVLSYGINPLLLDQPEDDLDNHLVYGLIVDRLRESKEKRQIIVITHNANIPVNGDAEYVFAMNSETSKISVLHEGTVENQEIKKEICTVMEGGEEAFRLRSKRYNLFNI